MFYFYKGNFATEYSLSRKLRRLLAILRPRKKITMAEFF
jgi:hypothetical protein